MSHSLSVINAIFKCGVIVLGESQLLGFENLEMLRCCVLLLLWNFNLSLFLSHCVSLSLSLSLFFSPFIAFVVDIILTMIVEYFWDLHCLAVVCCFWYLQLCLFYFCLSGTTILTLINYGIFVLVFALIVCIVSCFSRSGWVHVFPFVGIVCFFIVY